MSILSDGVQRPKIVTSQSTSQILTKPTDPRLRLKSSIYRTLKYKKSFNDFRGSL